MKSSIQFLTLFLFSTSVFSQENVTKIINIKLDNMTDFCRKINTVEKCERHFNFTVSQDEVFSFVVDRSLIDEETQISAKEILPGYESIIDFDQIENKVYQVDEDTGITLEISFTGKNNDGDDQINIWKINVSGEAIYPNNSNFLFVSVIKSIAGAQPESELLDINFKFNYLNQRLFSLLAIDFDFAQTPPDSGVTTFTNTINEAFASVNLSTLTNKQKSKINDYHRMFFVGAGGKIFNKQLYLGGQLGSIEIGGPFYSSYVLFGFYVNPYGTAVTKRLEPGNNMYRHNIYSEFAFSASEAKKMVPILKDLRIKVGFMFPLKREDDLRPLPTDILSRVVLEVPIGGIFKFRAK